MFFRKESEGKSLQSGQKCCIFAPAIEGNVLGAWKRSSMMTQAGDKWWQAPVINDDPEKDKKRGYHQLRLESRAE